MRAPRKFYQGRRVRFDRPDREWMNHHYWVLGKSAPRIAKEYGCTHHAVIWWMKKLGIRRRNRQEFAVRHSERMSGSGNPAWNGGIGRKYHYRLVADRPQICEWCNATDDLQVHHVDNDPTNGDPSNLAILCGTCNRLEAHLRALQESERASIMIGDRKIIITFQEAK